MRQFAGFFRNSPDIRPLDFCTGGEDILFPRRAGVGVVDYFFFNAAHQFGFWYLQAGRYGGPMISALDGKKYKGSDYIFRCMTRQWLREPEYFSPAHMTDASDEDWNSVFSDDTGRNPLPMWPEHLEIIHSYAKWFNETGTTPEEIVAGSNGAPQSLRFFLDEAGRIPGYREDPMRKKLLLLAIMMENRPEHFLDVRDPASYEPIIDYHLQRSALRTGLVEVVHQNLKMRLERREELGADEESMIRRATFDAIRLLVKESGASVAAIDYFFFSNRTRCPEMTEPRCAECPVNAICAHETKLFQPVFRTTSY